MQNSIQTNFEFLQFIDSKKLSNWSVKYLLEGDFGYNENYELIPISSFLNRSKDQVLIQDNKNYKRITIRQNNGGISVRDELIGKKIGTKNQFIVRKGQFLLSKIDARNGAFGVVPDDVDGAIITGNFWTYDVDYSKVDPYYLALITTTPQFISFCQRSSAGTTNRHYLQEALFLKERIPLPLISEQEAFSKAYQNKLNQADKLEQEATNLEEQIEGCLLSELGIELDSQEKREIAKLHFIEFINLNKWDGSVSQKVLSNKWENIQLSNILKLKSGNFLPASKMIKGKYSVYGGNGFINNHNEYFLEGKRLIIGRVGAYCGNVHSIDGKYWITDNALYTEFISNDVNIEYLKYTLRLINLNSVKSVSAQPSISQSSILELSIPVPPLETQIKIAEGIQQMKDSQKEKFQQAQQLKKQALLDFENAIFKPAE